MSWRQKSGVPALLKTERPFCFYHIPFIQSAIKKNIFIKLQSHHIFICLSVAGWRGQYTMHHLTSPPAGGGSTSGETRWSRPRKQRQFYACTSRESNHRPSSYMIRTNIWATVAPIFTTLRPRMMWESLWHSVVEISAEISKNGWDHGYRRSSVKMIQ